MFDSESGLYYYNARYFEPELGRFIQPDDEIPDLWNPQSYNRYSYCFNDPLRYTDPSGHGPISDWWSATREGANIVGDWASGVGRSVGSFLARPFVTPSQQWDPNSYNALNGGTFGQQIPGVGNPATAPIKAGANALAQTAMMVGPMSEEMAAATTLKEVKEVVTIVEKETYEIIDGVRRSKAADLVGHDTITAQILNSEGKVVGTREIPVNQLLSPKSSIDVSTPGNMDRFMSTLNKTKAGSTPPPILVQPGSRGVPIKDVTLDPIGGH